MFSSPNIIWVMELRTTRWVGYAKCTRPKRSVGSIDEETGKKCGPFKDLGIGGG